MPIPMSTLQKMMSPMLRRMLVSQKTRGLNVLSCNFSTYTSMEGEPLVRAWATVAKMMIISSRPYIFLRPT